MISFWCLLGVSVTSSYCCFGPVSFLSVEGLDTLVILFGCCWVAAGFFKHDDSHLCLLGSFWVCLLKWGGLPLNPVAPLAQTILPSYLSILLPILSFSLRTSSSWHRMSSKAFLMETFFWVPFLWQRLLQYSFEFSLFFAFWRSLFSSLRADISRCILLSDWVMDSIVGNGFQAVSWENPSASVYS